MYRISDDRTVTRAYVNEICKRALRSSIYDCDDPSSRDFLYSFLIQRQIGFQLNYVNAHELYVFQIRFYGTVDGNPKTFKGRAGTPSVAAGLALMLAIEDNES